MEYRDMNQLRPVTNSAQELDKVASQWINKGHYVQEAHNNYDVMIDNYPSLPPYEVNDFMVLISEEPDNTWPGLWKFLHERATKRLKEKQLGMNCWQFVLICLMQSGFLTLEDLKWLYAHAASKPQNRIPDFMHGTTKRTLAHAFQAGDVLFFLKDKVIWHQAIAVSTSEYVHCLGENVARSSFQPTYDHIFKMSPPEVAHAVRTLKAHRFF